MELTPTQEREARIMITSFPFRLVFIATKEGEADIITAVTSRRIPNRLMREGWQVAFISK